MGDNDMKLQNILMSFDNSMTIEDFHNQITTCNVSIQQVYLMIFQFLNSTLIPSYNILSESKTFNQSTLLSLINVLNFIQNNYTDLTNISILENERILCLCIQILTFVAENTTNNPLNNTIVGSIVKVIQEIIKPSPNNLDDNINVDFTYTLFINSLCKYCDIRTLILFLIQRNKKTDLYDYSMTNITILLEAMKNDISQVPFVNLSKEILSLMMIFKANFEEINNELYSLITRLLEKSTRTEKEIKDFFKRMFELINEDEKNQCFEIGNFMLLIYENHIVQSEICQTIISTFFISINLNFYIELLQKTNLIKIFISKLYNQKDSDTVAFYFYFLNSISFSNNNKSNTDLYIPKREFQIIVESFKYFSNNEQMLKFILERLNSLFVHDKSLSVYFLEECDLFNQITVLSSTNKTITILLLDFIENLLKRTLNSTIWEKAIKANTFGFDTSIPLDSIAYKKIWIDLIYEQNIDIFERKVLKINQYITDSYLIPQQQNDLINCDSYIQLLILLLKSFTQAKNDVIFAVNGKLYQEIVLLIRHMILTIVKKKNSVHNVFLLFDSILLFIYQYNRYILTHKRSLKRKKTKTHEIIHSPVIFSYESLKIYLKDSFDNLSKEDTNFFLCYLFTKCLNYETNYQYETYNQDPIVHIITTFKIPSLIKSMPLTNIFVQSELLLKCITSVILKSTYIDTQVSLLSFLILLSKVNEVNISIILNTGIVKKLFKVLQSQPTINHKIFELFNELIKYFNKENLTVYCKHLYIFLIKKQDINTAKQLLNNIETNLPLCVKIKPSLILSPLKTYHPRICPMIFLKNQVIKLNNLNIFYSVNIHSIKSLCNFTLFQLVNESNSLKIYCDTNNLLLVYNGQIINTIEGFLTDLTVFDWYNIVISSGKEFKLLIKKTMIIITYPHKYVFSSKSNNNTSIKEVETFDFAIGYIFLKESNQNNPQNNTIDYYYNDTISFVHINYLLLTTHSITEDMIQENEKRTKYLMNPKLDNLPTKEIIAEIFFDEVILENYKILTRIMYKMSEPFGFDTINIKYVSKIKCSDGISQSNYLYIFKQDNLSEYISMNNILQFYTLTKEYFQRLLYSFDNNLFLSFNNVFISDMLYIILDHMDINSFLLLFEYIIRIIFSLNNTFQIMFFQKHLNDLKIILIKYAKQLKPEYVSLLLLNEKYLQYDVINNLFYYPELFIVYTNTVQNTIHKEVHKLLSEKNNIQEMEYPMLKNILINLWNILLYYEISPIQSLEEDDKLAHLLDLIKLLNLILNKATVITESLLFAAQINIFILEDYQVLKRKYVEREIKELSLISSITIQKQHDDLRELMANYKLKLTQKKTSASYISQLFKLKYISLMLNLNYEKNKKYYDEFLTLLFPDITIKNDQFSWQIDKAEGVARVRRRMELKQNPTINSQNTDLIHKIILDLCLYDDYSDSMLLKYMVHSNDKYQHSYICLLIETVNETESLLILGDNAMYIYTNIIIDKKYKLKPFTNLPYTAFWGRDDNEKEWDRIVSKEVNQGKEEKERQEFVMARNKNKKVRIKVLPYKDISEIHKRRYVHQNNSLEIFMKKGSSYCFVVFPKYRDELFSKILNNINSLSQSKIINLRQSSNNNVAYIKHYPLFLSKSKLTKKTNKREKTIINYKQLFNDASEKWSQCIISNFNYIMLINTLGGRSYSDLSQYFIFPWFLRDFFSNLSLNNEVFFRDLNFPTHAQSEKIRLSLKNKMMNSQSNNTGYGLFHKGVFYSNKTEVCFSLVRLKPYSDIAIEVHHSLDVDRAFTTMNTFCDIAISNKEWIPELVYFPELTVNINNYDLIKDIDNKDDITRNDVLLPSWAKGDPRFYCQIIQIAVEASLVSENLHHWIDLIFGIKMPKTNINLEYYNRYCDSCYANEDVKRNDWKTFDDYVTQARELGCHPIQILTKNHIQKKEGNLLSFIDLFSIFAKVNHCTIQPVLGHFNIKSKEIGDMKAYYEFPKYNTSNGEGGFCSFTINSDQTNDEFNNEKSKIIRQYFIVGKNKLLLGPSFTSFLSYSHSSIFISSPFHNNSFEYDLKENVRISSIIPSLNGKLIVVGLSNGTILQYRKRKKRKEPKSLLKKSNYPIYESKIMTHDKTNEQLYDFWKNETNIINGTIDFKQHHSYYLEQINFSQIPSSSIMLFALCESYSFLIAVDKSNIVYLYDFNTFKLRYYFNFKHISKKKYTIKQIKIIFQTGDFVLSTYYSIHVFSINGLPIVNMNIFETHLYDNSKITSIEAISSSETYIITGHMNGSIYISTIQTEMPSDYPNDNNEEIYHDNSFYKTYHSRYNILYQGSLKDNHDNQKKRNLIPIKKINISTYKVIFLKMTDDLMHLYIINSQKDLFCLGCDKYLKENSLKGQKCLIHKSQIKQQCKICRHLICEVCLENHSNESLGLYCEECNQSNTSMEKLIYNI